MMSESRIADCKSQPDMKAIIKSGLPQLYLTAKRHNSTGLQVEAKVGIQLIQENPCCKPVCLVERFELSQTISAKDPWAEHVSNQGEFAIVL